MSSIGVLTVIIYPHRVLPRGEDLLNSGQSWVGAQLMLAGENPCDCQKLCYPTPILIILLPIFLLPVYVATTLWAALQVAFAATSILLWLVLPSLPWITGRASWGSGLSDRRVLQSTPIRAISEIDLPGIPAQGFALGVWLLVRQSSGERRAYL